ncbi:hypothetical protein DSL64_26750 [Dyadobacter luteus]|uniref:Secretion system C-terminal sorting domain-containing protein n=1 Tax=Dyadobacter luteus TaxID=2259619 RepID=A0A3D8Y3D7_9BACT|nr:T9SS type A sorting domain-containing protein [Dyadobacter luteus]REA56520.1 hypothetical protein DSL64_26750 [Dyadobacter luteus]
MKKILNNFLAILLMVSVAFAAKAQSVDMALISPTVIPSPASYPGTATIGFKIVAEILDQPLSSDDLGISHARVTITLNNLQGSPSVMPTGDGAEFFNWQYIASQNTYIGTSKDLTMAADVIYEINLVSLPIMQATTTNNTGFLANLTPPGDLYASETNDDAVAIYTSAPLPVTLVSFNVSKEGKIAQMTWATTAETNSDYFEVQHSANGKQWAVIDKVVSKGESDILVDYTSKHTQPINGENLYRLRMVDKDQTFAYSSVKSIRFDGIEKDLSVYPNPVASRLYIREVSEVAKVQILSLDGKVIYQAGAQDESGIDVTKLHSGIYIVDVTRKNGVKSSQKIVVNK